MFTVAMQSCVAVPNADWQPPHTQETDTGGDRCQTDVFEPNGEMRVHPLGVLQRRTIPYKIDATIGTPDRFDGYRLDGRGGTPPYHLRAWVESDIELNVCAFVDCPSIRPHVALDCATQTRGSFPIQDGLAHGCCAETAVEFTYGCPESETIRAYLTVETASSECASYSLAFQL